MTFDKLDWEWIKKHYKDRVRAHQQITQFHTDGLATKFAEEALGIRNEHGNYSAREHGLGEKIFVNPNAAERIFKLAAEFEACQSPYEIPLLIQSAALKYLKIGVGSELSCMMKPSMFWVANTKSIWAHYVVVENGAFGRANDLLPYYGGFDLGADIAYKNWADIHSSMGISMKKIAEFGTQECPTFLEGKDDNFSYLWSDAISCNLYDLYRP